MRHSMWISVDPLMYDGTFWDGEGNSVGVFDAKTLSIYSFSFNNPLNVTDPDGRDIIIKGKNNSKIVVKTSLISFEANMSSGVLAMDFRGQHILQGDEALHFALDVIGLFDPTGAADGLNGSLYLKEGKYLDAAISGVGLLAYVGDTAKLNRLWKGYDKIKNMLKLKPCGCFLAGTQVLTEEGYKNIEEIQKGDIVWAFDDKTGDLQPKKVTETYTLEFSQIFKLYIGDEIVEVTHEHPFFIGGKWLKADELKVGDFVTLYDGTTKRIDKIEFIANGNFNVYTFEVEEYHSYFVGQSKILVHNGNPCNWKSVKMFGHAFSTHGAGSKNLKSLIGRLEKGFSKQGQFLNNDKAAEFLTSEGVYGKIVNLKPGEAIDIDLPKGLGQVLEKVNGKIVTSEATKVTIVRGKDNFIKTAIPKN